MASIHIISIACIHIHGIIWHLHCAERPRVESRHCSTRKSHTRHRTGLRRTAMQRGRSEGGSRPSWLQGCQDLTVDHLDLNFHSSSFPMSFTLAVRCFCSLNLLQVALTRSSQSTLIHVQSFNVFLLPQSDSGILQKRFAVLCGRKTTSSLS